MSQGDYMIVNESTPFGRYTVAFGALDLDCVPADPSKAYRCTLTIATASGWEIRVNNVMGEVYVRQGRVLRYVGRSSGNDAEDVRVAVEWMRMMRML